MFNPVLMQTYYPMRILNLMFSDINPILIACFRVSVICRTHKTASIIMISALVQELLAQLRIEL